MNKPLVILLVALAPSLFGQATSQIHGTITDPTDAGLEAAEVRARHTGTGREWAFTSAKEGTYAFVSLPPGAYQITATMTGFKTVVRSKILLQVGSNLEVNIQMEVGAVNDTITVTADAALVETHNISIGEVMDSRRIQDLPMNGRNANELVQLTGAVVPGGKNTTSGFPNSLNLSVAGGQLSGISYLLDGVMINNLLDAVSMPFPFPDALQEFKVETSTMTAKSGTHVAATVSAALRSGSNQFHGSGFEFFRNGAMNARNAFAPRRDTLKRNQFGGTIGGPIVRNKLFFFAAYQGTLTRSDPANRTAFVPSAQMLAGDFSCYTNPVRDPASPGTTFPGNQIPIARFSPQALSVVDFLPKSSDPCGKVSFGPITNSNEHQPLGRIDYSFNSKNEIHGHYMATTFRQPAPYALSGNVLDTVSPGLDDLAQSAGLGHTFTASPTIVNQLRVGFNRVAVRRFNEDYFSGCSIGVEMYCYIPNQTILNVGPSVPGSPASFFSVGIAPATPGTFVPTYFTLSDDLTVVRGAHTFAFGYSSFKYQHSQVASATVAGNFVFPGSSASGSTGIGMTDFMLGRLGMLTQSAPNGVYTNKWGHGIYVQDTWKFSRRLTLNYGLRWEPFLPQALNDGSVYNYSLDAFRAGVRSQVYPNAPPGLSYPGDPGFQGKTGVNKRWNQFAPRVGIAFDPRGNGMTSIRASAGIGYDFPNLQIMSNPTSAPPFANRVVTPGPVGFDKPYGNNPNPFPVVPGTFPAFGTFIAQQPDAKGPTTYTWNFSVQHQFGRDWFVSASYLGSQSIHTWVSQAMNPAVILPCPTGGVACNTTGNTNMRRLAYLTNPAADAGGKLGPVDMFESGGGSNYNGLILSTQKRLSQGVSFNANYTWSHCLGDLPIGSGTGGVSTGGGTFADPNDRSRDRGNCSTSTVDGLQALDRRHIFNFTTVLESPTLRDRTLNAVASHWMFSASYRVLSAPFLTATNGSDAAFTGAAVGDQRAQQLLDDIYCKPRNASCWMSRAAFGAPASGTLSRTGRATVAGPGYFGLDIAVSRTFRVYESITLEARGEAFNVSNSVRLNAPDTAINVETFGRVRTAQDPRILQLVLRLAF